MPRSPRRRATVAGLLLVVLLLPASPVLSATPTPTTPSGGDARSSGEGAGLVGAPFLVAAGVIVLGLVTAGVTAMYVRVGRDE